MIMLLLTSTYGQKNRAAHWYFGYEAGIDFSSGLPIADTTGNLISIEGSSSISDTLGNLLFYSNGEAVWNRNHVEMPNSSDIIGDMSAAQSSIIVPQPSHDSHYYLFSTLSFLSVAGLYYQVIDMNLDGGLGDITTSKNIQLHNRGTEELASTLHCNAIDYWIVGRQTAAGSLTFNAYLLDSTGLSSPVTSTFSFPNSLSNEVGGLTFSQDGSTLCFSSLGTAIYIFDFNKYTGQLVFRNSISPRANELVYSNALSADGSKLYITSWIGGGFSMLSQFDLSVANISSTRTDLDSVDYRNGSPNGYGFIGQVRLAPDQKIYVSRWHQDFPNDVHPSSFYSLDSLDVIHQPNQAGALCMFQRNALPLNQKPTQLGLPNFVSNFTAETTPESTEDIPYRFFRDTLLCEGESLILDVTIPSSTYMWQDDSEDSIYTISQAGTYWVKIMTPCGPILDTIEVDYEALPSLDLGNDTSLCEGENVILVGSHPNASYRWQDNSTDSIFMVREAGTYVLEMRTVCETVIDSIRIGYDSLLTVDVGNDTSLCQGERMILDVTRPDARYLWQDNSTDPTLTVIQSGTYWVELATSNVCGPVRDSITVSYYPSPSINLGEDTSLCIGDSLVLNLSIPNASYLWQDNSTDSTMTISQAGTYWVEVRTMCELIADGIVVTSLDDCTCSLFTPNAFSPNNDGRNESFSPVSSCQMSVYQLSIYNRWGNLIFETNQPATSWDGTSKGSSSPEGVYVYRLTYSFENGPQLLKSGSITLIR